jgi:hypothetical protein
MSDIKDILSDMGYWSKMAKKNCLAYGDSLDRGINQIEQLKKENEELRKELVAAVELMEDFNKAAAEFNNHDQ